MMEVNEKNPPRTEGAGESSRPRTGSRPQNRNHHRGKSRTQGGPKPDVQNSSVPAVDPAPTDASAPRNTSESGHKKQNRDSGKGRSNDRRENRPRQENTTTEPSEKRSRPSTGRPQRAPHRAPTPTDLPNMDDLLIEDGMAAAEETVTATVTEDYDAAEVERILARDPFAIEREVIPEIIPEGKVVIAGIRFREGGKTYFFNPGELTCTPGQYAIVETARGLEFGEVYIGNKLIDETMVVPPLRPIIRIATEEDIAHNNENHEREREAFRIGAQKIKEHALDMKLVAVQYTFDNAKLLFYFTSLKRVDFRELVRDLAGIFHIRIELRQIGIRDEARMIGGLGPCGRSLCCNTFLSDFCQVSMKMAKEQNLSLNSTKISGCCGRLMCCLRYEHETYVSELQKTPPIGAFVNTPDGPGMVTEVYILQGEVKVSLRGQTESAPKKYKREEVELQGRDRRMEVSTAEEPITEIEEEPDTDE